MNAKNNTITRFISKACIILYLLSSCSSFIYAQSNQSQQQKEFIVHKGLYQSIPSKRPTYLKTQAQLTEKTLVLLVSFPDTELKTFAKTTQQDWESVYFGNRPSIRDYYSTISFGKLNLDKAAENNNPVNNGIVGWNVLLNSLSWYKQTYQKEFHAYLVRDALISSNGAVDYAQFDGNGDSYISTHELHIYVIAAAYEGSYFGPPEPNVPRVHVSLKAPWRNIPLQLDGKFIGDYDHGGGISLSGELLVGSDTQNKVGLLAHEMGHSLGLPDHYNEAKRDEAGVWCLMGTGDIVIKEPSYPNHICAPHKEQLGWIQPTNIQAGMSRIINEIENSGESLKLWENGNPTTEYFIVENRNNQQSNHYDTFLPASGLLIWHVDSTEIKGGNNQGIALEQADNEGYKGVGNAGDVFSANTNANFLQTETSPNSRSNEGDITGVSVANISAPGPTMAAEIDVSHTPSRILAAAFPNTILANGVSTSTITALLLDVLQDTVESATNEVTFTITSGDTSGSLIGTNPVNAINGIVSISLQSTTKPGIVTVEASSPGLTSGSTYVNVYTSEAETEVSGTISTNTTWSLANSPYRVIGDITVAQGATLTIEPGVLVKFNSNRDLFVSGRLVADGFPNQRIAFTSSLASPTPNAWGGIRFNNSPTDSPSILDNCIISYGGQGGYGNLDASIIVDARANPQITNTSFSNNRYNGVNLITGTYSSDISLGVVGIPYVLRGDLTIASGAVLNIIPGVLLKFARNADFYINGGVTAEGNANSPIIFTSLRDDTRGGDTGGDGSTVGSVGDWGGIWFNETINDTKSILRYCEIYFGGQGGYGNNDTPISLDARANPTITNTTLSNNRFNGLDLNTGTYSSNIILDITELPYMIRGDLTVASGAVLTIQPGVLLKFDSNSDFNVRGGLTASGTATNHIVFTSFRDDSRGGDTNGDGATAGSPGSWGGIWFGATTDDNNAILRHCEIYFSGKGGYGNNNSPLVLDARANPILENVILADNSINGIWLETRTYDVDIDLDITELPYILGGNLTVGASAQLTIHPGTLLKMAVNTDLFIDGTLRLIGQESKPVVFTSFKDDSRGGDTDGNGATSGVPGDWGGIQFRDPSNDAGSVIEYSEFHFGGQGGYSANDSPLVFDNASPRIQKILITNTKSQGVRCYNTASPDFGGGARGSIGGNRFLDFIAAGNKYAIRNDGTADIFAKFNYWETSDPNTIEQIIFDRNDNSSKGQVIYEPFETDPTFPVNAPSVLLPLNGTELLPVGLLVWTEVHPVQNSDLITYTLQLDDDSTFASPEISQTGLTGEAYSNASLSAFIDEAVSLQANAIAVRLNSLTGFDNLIDNTNFYWRVKAVDNYGAESDYTSGSSHFFFNKTNSSPNSAIDGFSPKDGLEIRTSTPEISWHPATDPDLSDHAGTLRYNLKLDDDREFSSSYQYTTSMGLNTFDVIDQLTENLNWYYRVQTIDDEDLTSDWSAIQDFWINAEDEPPLYFDLLEPLDGTTVKSDSVRLRWQTAIDPDPNDRLWYVLEFSSDSLFKSLIHQVTQTDTTFVLRLDALTAGTYYWRVKGLDSDTLATYASRTDVRPWRFSWGVTNVDEGREPGVPTNFSLSQNYPNPFNPTTTIAYQLSKAAHVTLKIYNMRGQEVRTLVEEEKLAGYYSVRWDGLDKQGMKVSSGVYVYQMIAGEYVTSQKLVLLR